MEPVPTKPFLDGKTFYSFVVGWLFFIQKGSSIKYEFIELYQVYYSQN